MRQNTLEGILKAGVVAVIRMDERRKVLPAVHAIREGGVTCLEVTMTTPDALRLIEELASAFASENEVIVGAGSVLDQEAVRNVVDAGARFVVSPVFKPEIVFEAHRLDTPVMPGALTPTEVFSASESGADVVKVFPADLGGMSYFKAVLAPMPHLKLMPTGGVTLSNAGEWMLAGACAVGVGSALLNKRAIENDDFAQLTQNARILCASVNEARASMSGK